MTYFPRLGPELFRRQPEQDAARGFGQRRCRWRAEKVALCDRNLVCIKVTIANDSWINKRRTILKNLPGVLQTSVELKGLVSPRLRSFFHRTARNEFIGCMSIGLFLYQGNIQVFYLPSFGNNLFYTHKLVFWMDFNQVEYTLWTTYDTY